MSELPTHIAFCPFCGKQISADLFPLNVREMEGWSYGSSKCSNCGNFYVEYHPEWKEE